MEKVLNRKKTMLGNKGISLVEVMVAMLIFSMISVALYTTSIVGENSWQVNQARTELVQELRKAMDTMTYDLIETGTSAVSNVLADTDSSPNQNTAEDDDWYSSIIFQLPTGVSGGSLQWSATDTVFSLNSDGQIIKTTAAGDKVVAQNIASLGFYRSYDNSDIIEIYIEAEKETTRGRAITLDVNFSVKMRN